LAEVTEHTKKGARGLVLVKAGRKVDHLRRLKSGPRAGWNWLPSGLRERAPVEAKAEPEGEAW